MFVHTQHGQTKEQGYLSNYAINPLKTPLKFSAVFTGPDELDITQRFLAVFYLEHTMLLMAFFGLLFHLTRRRTISLKLPEYFCIFVLSRKPSQGKNNWSSLCPYLRERKPPQKTPNKCVYQVAAVFLLTHHSSQPIAQFSPIVF